MVPFGGWDMPLAYPSGTLAEHAACRSGAVIFDVSHLGTVRVEGEKAFEQLQACLTNDLARIAPGRAQYTHLLDKEVDYIQVPVSQTTLTDVTVSAPDNPNGAVSFLDNGGLETNNFPSLLKSNKVGPTASQQYNTITSTTRVPTASTVSVTLRPVYSRKNLHDRFNLNDFAQGKLIGTKNFGGFL